MRSVLIAKNSFWMALETVLDLVCGFVLSLVVARLLGPAVTGRYVYIVWLTSMMSAIATFGVAAGTRKYVAEYLGRGEPECARAIIARTLRWQRWSASAIVILGTILVLTTEQRADRAYSLLAVISVFPSMVRAVYSNALSGAQDYFSNTIPSVMGAATNLAVSACALALGWGLIGLTAGILSGRVVDVFCRWQFWLRSWKRAYPSAVHVSTPLPSGLLERMRRFAWQSSLLMALNAIVWDRSEILFLKHFSDVRQIAFYSLSFGIVAQLSMIPRAVAGASEANIMNEQGRNPGHVAHVVFTLVRYLALLALPLMLGMAAMSRPVILLLYGQAYAPAIAVLGLVAATGIFRALLTPAQSLLLATEKQALLVRFTLVMALVNLALDALLIPSHAAIGAAIANGCAQGLGCVGLWVLTMKALRLSFPVRKLLRTCMAAALMAVPPLVVARTVSSPAIATVCGVAVGVACYLVLVRRLGLLDSRDVDRFLQLGSKLGKRLNYLYSAVIRSMVSVDSQTGAVPSR